MKISAPGFQDKPERGTNTGENCARQDGYDSDSVINVISRLEHVIPAVKNLGKMAAKTNEYN